jgi:Na+/H+ antiporter NhaD/arsenite permease-like protein
MRCSFLLKLAFKNRAVVIAFVVAVLSSFLVAGPAAIAFGPALDELTEKALQGTRL